MRYLAKQLDENQNGAFTTKILSRPQHTKARIFHYFSCNKSDPLQISCFHTHPHFMIQIQKVSMYCYELLQP
jgi:hypothetical protein